MRFLVVDDHSLIRDAMHSVLRSVDETATVLEAATGAQARSVLAAEPAFDLVLLDLRLPDADGLQLLSEIGAAHPATAVVMLTSRSLLWSSTAAGASVSHCSRPGT